MGILKSESLVSTGTLPPPLKPPIKPPRSKYRIWVLGCGGLIAITVLVLLVLTGIGLYGVYKVMLPFTSTSPTLFKNASTDEAKTLEVKTRITAFQNALDGDEAATITLTADELNAALTDEKPEEDLRQYLHFRIKDDKLGTDFSVPLSRIPGFSGRYFNGAAELNIAIVKGFLVITTDQFEINGKPISDDFMRGIRSKNLGDKIMEKPELAQKLKHVTDIRIADGQIEIDANGGVIKN